MNKVAHYLQQHLVGEVTTSAEARDHFSTDCSVLKMTPQIIVYPRTESDVRKITRFTWQFAERGRKIPITARGSGTDLSGAAVGSGITVVFPAHMNKILALDSKKSWFTVQPGTNYGKLQQTLQTHGLFLPAHPASMEYSTIGGAIANNASGEKSVKYGTTKDFVNGLRVVLANGEVIKTKKLSKREVNRKMGLASFEGEIYRAIDALLTENQDLIAKASKRVTKNSAGYDIWNVRDKSGSVDLTPLFVGSQGTLGIITEAKLEAETFNPTKTLIIGYFENVSKAVQAIDKIRNFMPSALEIVDHNLLEFLDKYNPNLLNKVVEKPFPKLLLFVEFDDISKRLQQRKAKKTQKILGDLARDWVASKDEHEQEDLWKIRASSASIYWQDSGTNRALPIIDDGIVPLENLAELINRSYQLFETHHLNAAIWGHAGDGNLHMQPMIDLTKVGERQKAFKIMKEYYQMVIELGGSTSASFNDGRIRAPYLPLMYGTEMHEVFKKIKEIFDPYDTLNPGVKIGTTVQDLQPLLRHDYSIKHLYEHLPRT